MTHSQLHTAARVQLVGCYMEYQVVSGVKVNDSEVVFKRCVKDFHLSRPINRTQPVIQALPASFEHHLRIINLNLANDFIFHVTSDKLDPSGSVKLSISHWTEVVENKASKIFVKGCCGDGGIWIDSSAQVAYTIVVAVVEVVVARYVKVQSRSMKGGDAIVVKGSNCGIIDWFDPPMCDRAVQIIPGLLRRMNDLQATNAYYRAQASNAENHVEATIADYHREARRMTILLVLSWLGFVFFYLVN
ncbi:hypothetical protein Tco_1362365 [Tanacetum coccineum]